MHIITHALSLIVVVYLICHCTDLKLPAFQLIIHVKKTLNATAKQS